jgi:hypothetical protein
MKSKDTVAGLKTRAEQIRAGIVDAEGALADAKRRQASAIAEGGTPDPKLASEITAGAVAIDASREALALVEQRLAEAQRAEEAERVEAVRRRLVQAEADAEKALLAIDPAVRSLLPIVAAARDAATKVGELMRAAGQPVSSRDRVAAFVIARLLADDILDAREFHGVRSHLLSGDPRIAAARSERLDAALREMNAEAERHTNSRERLEYQLRVAKAELREIDRRCASTASALRERGPAQQKVRDLEERLAKLEAAA